MAAVTLQPSSTTTTASAAPRKIRVLHLIHTMAYGGVETAVLNWLRSLDREHFEVHLACFANPGETEKPFVEAAQRVGLPVSKLPWKRSKPVWRAGRALARLIAEHEIDIVHAHNCYADVVTVLATRLRGLYGTRPVRTITTAYVWAEFDWKRNLIQWIDQVAMRGFDRVTAHCENTRIETLKRGFGDRDVPTLICGFETHRVDLAPAERERLRAEAGVKPGEKVLVNVARFYPEKAHVFLLECFADILRRAPHVHLWLCGVGPLEDEIRAAVERLNIGHRVRFLGFVTRLPQTLALADIQIHPAHIEGVPLAICEGMAAGLPVIASDVGGLPEVVHHGRSGVLIQGLDKLAFVRAALDLIERPDRARELGDQARHFIENDYSLRNAVARVEATYTDMVRAC